MKSISMTLHVGCDKGDALFRDLFLLSECIFANNVTLITSICCLVMMHRRH